MKARLALGLALALALAGCASRGKPYPETAAGNVTVRTALSGARAALHVYALDAQCAPVYLGTVQLDKPQLSIDLPHGRPTRLVFDFSSSRYLGSSRSTTSQEAVLRPRSGARYEIDASYRDDIYGVTLRERLAAGRQRELPLADPAACR
jgi:hypothetical protein